MLQSPRVLIVLLLFVGVAVAKDATPADPNLVRDREEFFETKIRPLLIERCFECHNEDAQESGLRLDSLQAMLDGGERGPAIVPGEAKNSLLIHAVNHSEAELQMPEGDKLLAQEIKDLAKWIDDGATWPGATVATRKESASEGPLFSDEEKSFWAFLPPELPEFPTVRDESWIQSDIDRFVLAKLEANNLEPAPVASKRSLIRRVYFDLIGLPPNPEQVEAFLVDDSPEAFERVVDRLLASPQYGERWGRHWLDVARYADSNGLDENWAFEFIYRYRDWVVDAFNRDLPYDQFVVEQLAGDLIEQATEETQDDYIQRVIATGFLSVGPKMIADDDPKKKKMDIIDEQLSTVSQTFMGLTVGCARCHDHKFDPIPTWDYYAMASIFKSTKTMEHLRVVAPVLVREFETPEYKRALPIYEAKHAPLVQKRNEFWKSVATEEGLKLVKADKEFALPKKADRYVPKEHKEQWKKLTAAINESEKSAPQKLKVMAPADDKPENLRVSLRGNYLTLGDQTQRQFLRIIDGETSRPLQTEQSGRLEFARWITSYANPLTARVFVNRVWRWRFGRGIVSTTDNFGKLGERPTHPRLLDYLAVKLVQDGWSIKQLHKRMLLSSTYQMGTRYDEIAAGKDPQNLLWWRFPRKRLEAEAIRDSLLVVSDDLDLAMRGSLMPLKDRSYVTGTASKTQEYDNRRRTIYQPVYRSAVYDVLISFDFPDPATPSGDRHTSTVAPQALLMMNSPLVEGAATKLAKSLLAKFETDDERIAELYRIALSREPTGDELFSIRSHLSSGEQGRLSRSRRGGARNDLASGVGLNDQQPRDNELAVWMGLCRVVLSSNEFVYLD